MFSAAGPLQMEGFGERPWSRPFRDKRSFCRLEILKGKERKKHLNASLRHHRSEFSRVASHRWCRKVPTFHQVKALENSCLRHWSREPDHSHQLACAKPETHRCD